MRKTALLAIGLAVVLGGCRGEGKVEGPGPEGQVLLPSKGEVSFSPDGSMFVFTSGTSLAIRKVGDERIYWLTAEPPAGKDGGGGEGAAATAEPGKDEKCVPAKPTDPLPGPQGGWQGQSAWSPDGRFIAFMAPWADRNCVKGDDVDWDIWVVDVGGLDLATWVKEVAREKPEGEKGEPEKDYFIVGPGGAGLAFYQVSTAAGTDQRPSWATCRSLAWSTPEAVVKKDLAGIPGVCDLTMAERIAVCERKAAELERSQKQMEKQCAALDAGAPGLTPAPEAPPAAPAAKAPAPAQSAAKAPAPAADKPAGQ